MGEIIQADLSMEHLKLDCDTMTPIGVAKIFRSIAGHPSLTSVNLSCVVINVHVGMEGAIELAAALKTTPQLRTLRISNSGIGFTLGAMAVICQGIAENTNLQTIDMSGNRLGIEDANMLCHTLCESKHANITTLILKHNPIGCLGTAAVAEFVRTSRSLTMLDMSDTEMTIPGLAILTESLGESSSLTHLFLNHNKFRGLPRDALLLEIEINDCKSVMLNKRKVTLEALLAKLGLGGVCVSPRLGENETLEHLEINHCFFNDRCCEEVSLLTPKRGQGA